jgi:NTE family protein
VRSCVSAPNYLAWQGERARRRGQIPDVDFVAIDGTDSTTAELVADRIEIEPGEPLDVAQLEQDIGGAYGRGTYERISYRFAERNGSTGIEVAPVDKEWGPLYFRPASRSTTISRATRTISSMSRRG